MDVRKILIKIAGNIFFKIIFPYSLLRSWNHLLILVLISSSGTTMSIVSGLRLNGSVWSLKKKKLTEKLH